jgi:hypothetical protein
MNYQKKVVSLVRTSVQLAGVKHQVPRTMVDVSMTQFAQKLVRKRVGQMDIVRAPQGIGTRYVGFHRTSHLPYDAHSLNRLIWWSDGLYATGGRFLLNCFH